MNNSISPSERRQIDRLLSQGMQQSEVARIVKRSRATITNIASERRKMVAESQAKVLTSKRGAK